MQIEYARPASDSHEGLETVENLVAVDLDTEEGRQWAANTFAEFLQYQHYDPFAAHFEIGGVCECAEYMKKPHANVPSLTNTK